MERVDPPKWLIEDCEQWGKDYKESKDWSWKVGEKKYKELTSLLKQCSKYHCSYCDSYRIGTRNIKDTIDHFRPKAKFPLIAYQWENLFISCHYCQEKGDKFDELLLKPDEQDYFFYNYFEYDKKAGKIIPNPNRSSANQERARITIDLFKLNGKQSDVGTDDDITFHRKALYKKHLSDPDLLSNIDVYPYRYMFAQPYSINITGKPRACPKK